MKPLTLATSAFSCLAAGTACGDSKPTATIDAGPVVGVQTVLPNAIAPVNKYLGIPCAASPERFGLPEPPQPWTEPYNASQFGPSCRQFLPLSPVTPGEDVYDGVFGAQVPESEDCLYLNAFSPASPSPPGGRPVVLFIHGGGFQLSNGRLDLSGFAGYEDIVAFSFNYRTNIFGFPNSPDIATENKNLGFHDQQHAIAWVQANAAAFGGDPSKVTIWGESAGAISVDAHIHAYAGADPPPFRAAAMFSGQMSWGFFGATTRPDNTASWEAVAEYLGCEDGGGGGGGDGAQLACMRDQTDDAILDAINHLGTAFGPVLDNLTIPDARAEAWRTGNVAKVPVLSGSIAQEGRSLLNRNITIEQFTQAYLAEDLIPAEQQGKIVDYYREVSGLTTDYDIASAIYTDFLIQCPARILSQTSASIDNPAWRFYFNISITDLLPAEFQYLGKFHGSDVGLLFSAPTFAMGNDAAPSTTETPPWLSPVLYTFVLYFRGFMGRFIRNPSGGPGWPAAGAAFEPFVVVTLGDVGGEQAGGATPVNATELDAACRLYEDVYPLIEKYVL